MKILHVLMTHLPPDQVRRQLRFLEQLTPGVSRLVAYGGPAANLAALEDLAPILLEDESLRGDSTGHCLNELLVKMARRLAADDRVFDFIHVTEYDHLILRRDYFEHLAATLETAGCDFLACACGVKTQTNWYHLFEYRDDPQLIDYLRGISRRDCPTEICGCLLNGYSLSTRALQAITQRSDIPAIFSEVLFPTLVHHLGFKIGDVGEYSDLFRHIRYRPSWTKDEVRQMLAAGGFCCHPIKNQSDAAELEHSILDR